MSELLNPCFDDRQHTTCVLLRSGAQCISPATVSLIAQVDCTAVHDLLCEKCKYNGFMHRAVWSPELHGTAHPLAH